MAQSYLIAVLALVAAANGAPRSASKDNTLKSGANTATTCAACTVIVSLIEQLAQVHNNTIDKEVEKICDLFPDGPVRDGCDGVIMTFGPIVIELLAKKETPDVVCHAITLCTGTCHLFPAPPIGVAAAGEAVRSRLSQQHQADVQKTADFLAKSMTSTSKTNDDPLPPICNLPGLHDLCEIIFGFANDHLPLEDADHDGFSGHTETFRGTNWRGKDCAPDDSQTYPGARPVDDDREKDSNCNGIYGVNPTTGVPYEVEMCAGTNQFGIAVLGDSASAHFHVPPEFLTAQSITDSTFKDILPILENEFDWPMLSATTAYFNGTASFPNINGPVNSSYEIMRSRNRCMHRDYQNIAVNGARSGAMNTTIQAGLSRVTGDHPLLLTYALIGNDVCNGHEDTVADMTTPAVMRANVLATMEFLDSRLPVGCGMHLAVLMPAVTLPPYFVYLGGVLFNTSSEDAAVLFPTWMTCGPRTHVTCVVGALSSISYICVVMDMYGFGAARGQNALLGA
eukprot:m.202731 g.202731  ORF g.202731 m.202731 type:complete len:510 (+) comp18841_c0_seq3:113-1642(+)